MSRLSRWVLWIAVLWGYLFLNFSSYGPSLIVYFLDVGQGDSMLVITPSERSILVDGGPYQTVIGQLDKRLPFWQRQVDVVMASHADDDHISGLVSVLERYTVPLVLQSEIHKDGPSYDRLQSLVAEYKIDTQGFYDGQELDVDGVSLRSHWPSENHTRGVEINHNDLSQVVSVHFDDFAMLLTGDAEAESLTKALADWQGDVDVLKVPHHGSKGGLNNKLLEKFQPNVSIISSGSDNRFGHPHEEILQLLSDNGTQIYRTDTHGTVKVVVDGSGFSVYSEK